MFCCQSVGLWDDRMSCGQRCSLKQQDVLSSVSYLFGLYDVLWSEMFSGIAGCYVVSQWFFGMIGCSMDRDIVFGTAGCSVVSQLLIGIIGCLGFLEQHDLLSSVSGLLC